MSSLKQCYIDGFIERRRTLTDEEVAEYFSRMFDVVYEEGIFQGRIEGYEKRMNEEGK